MEGEEGRKERIEGNGGRKFVVGGREDRVEGRNSKELIRLVYLMSSSPGLPGH